MRHEQWRLASVVLDSRTSYSWISSSEAGRKVATDARIGRVRCRTPHFWTRVIATVDSGLGGLDSHQLGLLNLRGVDMATVRTKGSVDP